MARAKETSEELLDTIEEEYEELYFPPITHRDEENFVLIGCNGEFIKVKKGERVKVPKRFANVIRSSEAQKAVNAEKLLKANS